MFNVEIIKTIDFDSRKEISMELKRISLKQLLEDDKPTFTKAVHLLQEHKSYDYILKYLESKGYKFAKGSITNLKNKVEESRDTGTPLEDLMDKRGKKSVNDVDPSKIVGRIGQPSPTTVDKQRQQGANSYSDMPAELLPNKKYYSSASVLDGLVQKGIDGLNQIDTVDTGVLLKAIELREKYFPSRTGRGLSDEALKQYQLISQARSQASIQTMMEYVPANKQQEALDAMDKAEKEILDNMGADDETQALLDELRKANLDV